MHRHLPAVPVPVPDDGADAKRTHDGLRHQTGRTDLPRTAAGRRPTRFERGAGLKRVAAADRLPAAAAALQFPLANPLIAGTIPGRRTPREPAEPVEWWEMPIPAAFWRDLEDEDLLDSAVPVPT